MSSFVFKNHDYACTGTLTVSDRVAFLQPLYQLLYYHAWGKETFGCLSTIHYSMAVIAYLYFSSRISFSLQVVGLMRGKAGREASEQDLHGEFVA